MSSEPTKCRKCSSTWAGQVGLMQRVAASPGSRTNSVPHSGHFLGMCHDRLGLFQRELEGEGPARAAGNEAELCLLPEVVDLDDDAVDSVIELVAFLLPLVEEADDGIDVGMRATVRVDVKAHLGEPVEDLLLAPGSAGWIEGIDERIEPTAGRDAGIELP